jgi:hypothetical protein
MLTMITEDLWLDFDKLVRVSLEGSEIKYTIDFKEKLVTYYAPASATKPFIAALKDYALRQSERLESVQTTEELIDEMLNNPTGEEV